MILSDVYLKCETGQIIGLLGRNGSGKSTLFKIISGLSTTDYDHVTINGVLKNKSSETINEIQFLSQENYIPKHLSVRKVISLSIIKHVEFENDEIIKHLLEKKIKQLSTGELRYLAIKIILNKTAKFVLLDEPFNGLSPLMIEKISQLIVEKSKLKGIIITDHNYENVVSVATKLVVMKEGKLYHLKNSIELSKYGYLTNELV